LSKREGHENPRETEKRGRKDWQVHRGKKRTKKTSIPIPTLVNKNGF